MKRNNTKKMTFLGIMASLALILSYVETLLPPIYAAVPGIKMGLPNIIIIFILYRYSVREAAVISLIRLVVTTLLFGNVMTFLYSLAGAFLSITIMAIFKKLNLFSTIGVSIAGAVMHNLGQILVAILLLGTKEIGYYMIVLAISGTIAGVFIGLLGSTMLRYIKRV